MTCASIALGPGALVLGVALLTGAPALAGDVSVQLDAGSGFSVKDSTGTSERLRVDEVTGNVSRNGALFVHTTGLGVSNTFVGANAGNTATTASAGNTALGASALRNNTVGVWNSAVGYRALFVNTTGNYNSSLGYNALRDNGAGSFNSALGSRALAYNTTGRYNSAVGASALRYNTTGRSNSAVGYGALRANTTGIFNTAFGSLTLFSNSTGVYNTAVGYAALNDNTTGGSNSAVGIDALFYNTTGNSNSAVGRGVLRSNTTGSSNAAVGSYALRFNSTGLANAAFGTDALRSNTTGQSNSAVGDDALRANTTGFRNSALGQAAGSNQTTGSDNIYLANLGVAAESTTIRIGCPAGLCAPLSSPHSRAFIAGIRGVITGSANAIPVLIDSNGQLGTASSSRSVKNDIRDMGAATDRLLDLRPVTFRYKPEQTLPSGGKPPQEYGLIAEEVAEVFPDLVVYDEQGQPFTVKYHEMAPMLLNEMQKQQQTIERQEHAIEGQRQVNAELSARLALIEGKIGSAAAPQERTR